jgi:hypothetical protein
MTHDSSGVDLSLIRVYLALTPIERLRSLQNSVRAIQKFKRVNDASGTIRLVDEGRGITQPN